MKKPRLEAFDPNPAAEQPKPHREGRSRITYGISPLSKSSFYGGGSLAIVYLPPSQTVEESRRLVCRQLPIELGLR
jgi:hypothetical protein